MILHLRSDVAQTQLVQGPGHVATLESISTRPNASPDMVAVVDRQVVGTVFLEVRGDDLYFARLAVLSASRGRSIARLLLVAAENLAVQLGCHRATAGVRRVLTTQRADYARLDFREVGLGTHAGYAAPTHA